MAGLFQVLWGQSEGAFQAAEALTGTDGEPLVIPAADDPDQVEGMGIIECICTRPFAVDWDADGDLDLIVGSFGGSFYLFRGEGEGKFVPTPEKLHLSNEESLKIEGQHSDPFVIDWDGDGDLDLLSGSSSGGVQWAENTAGAGKPPVLSPFEYLVKADQQAEVGQLIAEDELTGPTTSTRIWVDDVNADGKLDLLVGDKVTLTSPVPGLTEAEYRGKRSVWQKDFQEAMEEYTKLRAEAQEETSEEAETTSEAETEAENKEGEVSILGTWLKSLLGVETEASMPEQTKLEKAQAKVSELYEQKSKFMRGESTGFVWLYLQK